MLKNMSEYKYYYSLRVRIYPNTKQKCIIKASSDASRFVYNKLVEYGKEISAFGKPSIYIKVVEERLAYLKKMSRSITELKNTFSWLCSSEIDTMAIGNAKRNYNKAWNMYRKVLRFSPPTFHKKTYVETYQTSAQYDRGRGVDVATLNSGRCKFFKKHVKLPVIGKIRYAASNKLMLKLFSMSEIRIGTITITKDNCGDYFASFQLASDEPFVKKSSKTGSQVGIDLNIENFYADSNGHIEDNPHYYRKAKRRLAKAQRKLDKRATRAKKEKRSLKTAKNYQKQRILVSKIIRGVKNRRRNFLHNQSMSLINNHDLVVAEELRSKNMMKNNVLAFSIQDNGWRMFLNMLKYKSELYGKQFKTVNPKNTTQTCSHCGHTLTGKTKLTLKDREWTCPVCGKHHVRDINAAKNILAKGLITA